MTAHSTMIGLAVSGTDARDEVVLLPLDEASHAYNVTVEPAAVPDGNA